MNKVILFFALITMNIFALANGPANQGWYKMAVSIPNANLRCELFGGGTCVNFSYGKYAATLQKCFRNQSEARLLQTQCQASISQTFLTHGAKGGIYISMQPWQVLPEDGLFTRKSE